MKKKKNKKLLISSLVILGIAAGIYYEDRSFDHTKDYCLLSDVFGLQHQVDAINRDSESMSHKLKAILIKEYNEVIPNGYTNETIHHEGEYILLYKSDDTYFKSEEELMKFDVAYKDFEPVKILDYTKK